jgi:hypothetical protein
MKLWLRVLIGIVGVIVLIGGILQIIGGLTELTEAGLAKCDSDNAKNTLKAAFNESQYSKSNSITFDSVSDIAESAYDPDKSRSCHGSLKLSDQQTHSVDYQIEAKPNGEYQLRFSMK